MTSAWPANASSIWPLSAPTWRHCATKPCCARRPIRAVTTTDSGTVTSAISAKSGEIHTSIASTPIAVSAATRSCDSTCCNAIATLSMSLVTRLSTSPWGWRSKYASGTRMSLASTSARSRRTVPCTARLSSSPCSHNSSDASA